MEIFGKGAHGASVSGRLVLGWCGFHCHKGIFGKVRGAFIGISTASFIVHYIYHHPLGKQVLHTVHHSATMLGCFFPLRACRHGLSVMVKNARIFRMG